MKRARAVRRVLGLMLAAAVVAVIGVLPANVLAADRQFTPARASAQGPDGALWTLAGRAGTLTGVPGRSGVFRLVLMSPDRDVTVLRDRPGRRVGSESLRDFVSRWRQRGLDAHPPLAALELIGARRSADVAMLELSRPRLGRGGRSISYLARPAPGQSTSRLTSLARRADRHVPARFGQAKLFIDSAPASSLAVGQTLARLTLTFTIPHVSNSPIVVLLGTVHDSGPTAPIDLTAPSCVQVFSPGPITFTMGAGGGGFTLSSTGSTSATVSVVVNPTQDPIRGTIVGDFRNSVTVSTPSGARALPDSSGVFTLPAH